MNGFKWMALAACLWPLLPILAIAWLGHWLNSGTRRIETNSEPVGELCCRDEDRFMSISSRTPVSVMGA